MTPFLTREITDEKEYFGRDHIIQQLTAFANRGDNKEIIGLRRSGKTSLLKITELKLRQNEKSKAYPIFFDFKSTNAAFEKGAQFAYKYMIARLIARLYEDGIHSGNFTIRGLDIKPSSYWEDIYDCLQEINKPKTMGIFSELIELCAQETNKSILFLIDEYEYLLAERFDGIENFYDMRSLGNKTTPDGNRIFSFWISGATDWFEMCSRWGSPPLNTIDTPTIFLGPLDRDAFHAMWGHEIEFTNDDGKKRFLLEKEETAFNLSGGFPLLGKQIGNHLLVSGKDPEDSFFDIYFKDIQRILNEPEKKCLYELTKNNQSYGNLSVYKRLEDLGLIKKQVSDYEISIPFYKDYLISNEKAQSETLVPEASRISEQAEGLVYDINILRRNFNKKPVFAPDIETQDLWKNIRTPCKDRDNFSKFLSSLYKLIYETSKDTDPNTQRERSMERFPKQFWKNYDKDKHIFAIIGTLRHTLGDAHSYSKLDGKTQKKYSEILKELKDNKFEPKSAKDFQRMQIEVLKRLVIALQDLYLTVKHELGAGNK
jgi:hypothetical protein